jgi:hypothetical protein
MSFEYVLFAFSTAASPPDSGNLQLRKEFAFAPLATGGPIYTIDFDLWEQKAAAPEAPSQTFCPSRDDVLHAWARSKNENRTFLMGLTQSEHFVPAGPPGAKLPLNRASDLLENSEKLVDLGFDVVDQLTGISGLANIGYSSDDLKDLGIMGIGINNYNLLPDARAAKSFAAFASRAAQEHAPFIPVRVIARLPPHSVKP